MQLALRVQGYNNDYDTLGLKGSFNTIGPSFASAAASPLAYYKFYAGEGGMRVPLIVAGASIPAAPRLSSPPVRSARRMVERSSSVTPVRSARFANR